VSDDAEGDVSGAYGHDRRRADRAISLLRSLLMHMYDFEYVEGSGGSLGIDGRVELSNAEVALIRELKES
jgi:hypothetical protein